MTRINAQPCRILSFIEFVLKRPTLLFVLLFAVTLAQGQAQPNLENGFKHYGSYDFHGLDTVNVMNGNLMLHSPVPLPAGSPQRGGIHLQTLLYVSSKGWQVKCIPASSGSGQTCFWAAGATSVAFEYSYGLRMHRTVLISYSGGTGNTTYEAYGYTITEADGATHQLAGIAGSEDANGEPTKFESLDTSGYHLELANFDSAGIANAATVIDRHGNQYMTRFLGYQHCDKPPNNVLSVGGHEMMLTVGPLGDQYCSQTGWATQVTDSNGNRISYPVPGGATTALDTMGRTWVVPSDGSTSDYSGCVSGYPVTGVGYETYSAPDGTNRSMKVCMAQIPRQSFFNQPGIIEYQNYSTPQPLTAIVTLILADGRKWTFDYDNYGMVTRIGLPTGGSISYTWTTISFANCNPTDHTGVSRAVASRTVTDNNGHSSTWTYTWGTAANGSLTNQVTDALGNDTVHTFTSQDGSTGCNFYETQMQIYQGTGSARQLLKQVDTAYTSTAMTSDTQDFGSGLGNVKPKSVQTTLYPSGKVSLVTYEYDPGLGNNGPSFGNVTVQKEYDWGAGQPGSLLREIDNTYQWQVDSRYLTAHLIDLPASVVVKDGTGCTLAKTTYGYDESGYLQTYPGTLPTGTHVAPPYGLRGNQTSVNRYLWNLTSGSCASVPAQPSVVSHTAWYNTGEAYQQIDPLGHTSTHSYDSTYAGAYSTQTCNALNQCVSGTYDFNTGVLTSFTDANGTMASGNTPGDAAHTSNYGYDYMFRLILAQAPPDPSNNSTRAQTSVQYSAANSLPLNVQRQKTITSTLNDVATTYFDGLARPYQTQHAMPSGTAKTDTVYDGLDQATSVSNPYFATNDSTYGVVQTTYDALGRVTRTQKQDNSASTADYSDGNCTTTTDEAGKQRRACSDALGRLVSVDEPGDTNATASSVPASGGTQASGSVTLMGAEQFPPDTGGGGGGGVGGGGLDGCGGGTVCGATSSTATFDTGTVWITINGRTYSVSYGSTDTVSTIAANLASIINADLWAGVKATPSAGTINFTSVAAASTANYSLSAGSTYDSNNFPQPSFTTSAAGMSGGTDGPPVFGGHAYTTLYSYDALGNLLQVTQKGGTADQSKWRIRTSTYDSLSRLVTASNPESGTITYFYDNAGNLLQKVMPSPNQVGSAQHTISYCYDALNRVNGKAYSWQNCQNGQLPTGTAVVSYSYDQGTNGIGHLTSVTNQAGSDRYSYDSLGRMASEQRIIAGISKSMAYSYNLDGSVKTLTYPSGAVITYTLDAAGRMLSAVDSANNINYVTGANYGPDSALTGFISGQSANFAGITSTLVYNKRLQPCRIAVSSTTPVPADCMMGWGNVLDLGYDFHLGNGDNGNVYGITRWGHQDRNQTFTYDGLNRLISAQNAGTDCSVRLPDGRTEYWGNSYAYDPWGNLLQKNVTKCAAENLIVTADTHNWIHTGAPSDYGYDAAGNMTSDPTDGVSMTYDSENRIATATKNGVSTTYTYDADGNRVKKTTGTGGTLYWYMSPGIVAESDFSGALKSEYVFFDGERVARKDLPGNAISYYFSDRLKTASVITDSMGKIKDESDYYPWGGELRITNSGTNHYKFTGKERDAESGLDYFGARYYANSVGRFITPDWSATPQPVPYADLENPQTLNLYSYVGNNPILHADSDGHAKDEPLSGKYTVRIDRNNMNDMPNVHLKKGGIEVARGVINPETRDITWTITKKGFPLGEGIRLRVLQLAEEKGLFEAARERLQFIRTLRAGVRAGGNGGEGGTGGLARALVILQLVDAGLQAYNTTQFNKLEPQTGLKMDAFGNIRVTDIQKATQVLDPGTQLKADGQTFTLGEDRQWRDMFGQTVHLYQGPDGKVHASVSS